LAVAAAAPALVSVDPIPGALDRVTGEPAGLYNIPQGTIDPGTNYSLSFTTGVNFIIAGAKAIADEATRPAGSNTFKISLSTLQSNDHRIETDGSSPDDQLSITGAASGPGYNHPVCGCVLCFGAAD